MCVYFKTKAVSYRLSYRDRNIVHNHRNMTFSQNRAALGVIFVFCLASIGISPITHSNLGSESCDTLTQCTHLHISSVDQYMNYSGCTVSEFIPMVLPCWLSAVWRSSVGNYSPCVQSSGPCTVSEAGTLGTYKWSLLFVVCGLILSSASLFSTVSLGLGVFCMPSMGVGLLMKVVFNLVKRCRDKAFDICMDGMVLQWLIGSTGLERPTPLFSVYREHYVQKDRAASRELMRA